MRRKGNWNGLWQTYAAIFLTCLGALLQFCDSVHYRNGGSKNGSQNVHVQLTQLRLDDFVRRGSLHVDKIELRSEENDRHAFYIHNPTDTNYPLWAAARATVTEVWPLPQFERRTPPSAAKTASHGDPRHRLGEQRKTLTADVRRRRVFRLEARLRIRLLGGSARCDVVRLAVGRFIQHAFAAVIAVSDDPNDSASDAVAIGSLEINVRNSSFQRLPHLDMREDYEIKINATGIRIEAQENWGVLRGLETLSQLIFVLRREPNKFLIHANDIVDRPAFKYRGLMIDTSRHFIQKTTLLENLEAMAMNKMNVFHWHMVDDQSFPYLSRKFPHLAFKSAYSGGRYFYSAKDIREIVEFARQRGIRVVPEFDTPDHTHSWGHAIPDIVSWCIVNNLAYSGPLDPTNPATYRFLSEFYEEIADLFPDTWLHLGMDEVSVDCWRLNSTIQKFMQDNRVASHEQLIVYYANKLSKIIENLSPKKKSMVWEDILGKDGPQYPLKLPRDTIVQVWITRDSSKMADWRKQYRLIRSEDWYLDHRGYGADWVKRYRFQPDPGDLGGEACMWTEFQSDSTVTQGVWPSVSAVAERLWSGAKTEDPVLAAARIEEQNCRMQARGIRVGVAGGPTMCQNPMAAPKPPWLNADPLSDGGGGVLLQQPSEFFLNVEPSDCRYCWVYKWASIALVLGYLVRRISRCSPGQEQLRRCWPLPMFSMSGFRSLARHERVLCCFLAVYCSAWIILQL